MASEPGERASSGWGALLGFALAREGRAGFSMGAAAVSGVGVTFFAGAFFTLVFLVAAGAASSALTAFFAGARLGLAAGLAAVSEDVEDGSALMLECKVGSAELFGDLVRDIKIGVNVLGVVVVRQDFLKVDHLFGDFGVTE